MKAATKRSDWTPILRFYSEQNAGRPTRVGVFEPVKDGFTDYWLENGVPLIGIDLDARHELPTLRINLVSLTREIKNVVKLSFDFTISGEEDGINVLDSDGRLTILRFEKNEI